MRGLTIGVQQGNTSQPVADKLVAEGRAARVRVYAYDDIDKALADLSTGGCDAFMKLAPVMHWLVRDRPKLKVVQTGITRELLGISVRKGNAELRDAIDRAQQALRADGTLPAPCRQMAGSRRDGSTVVQRRWTRSWINPRRRHCPWGCALWARPGHRPVQSPPQVWLESAGADRQEGGTDAGRIR